MEKETWIKVASYYFETHLGEREMFSWELFVDGVYYTDSLQANDGKGGFFDSYEDAMRAGEEWRNENESEIEL